MLVKSSMMKSTSTISMMVNARGEAFRFICFRSLSDYVVARATFIETIDPK